jgi:hypothetical protein
MDTWVQLISSLGVPVVAMLGLAWYIVKKDKESRERDSEFEKMIMQIMETHKSEIKELQDVINNNTLVLTKVYERLGGNNS